MKISERMMDKLRPILEYHSMGLFRAFEEGRQYERNLILSKQQFRKEKLKPQYYVIRAFDNEYPSKAEIVLWAFENEIVRDSGRVDK